VRIALLSPVWFPVPPTGYGGIEWVVALLADGLVDAGHEVVLFASGDSGTKAELHAVFPVAPSERIGQTLPELHHALACYEQAADFDVVNDHSGLVGATLAGCVDVPVVHTVHGPLDGEAGPIYAQIAHVAPRLGLISLSLNQRRPRPDLPWIANCPNALDLSAYPVHPHRGDYLLFLGRLSPDKGAHHAIAVAKETGLPLKLAGKMRDVEEKEYFESQIRPNLGWGIEYLGEVSHERKVDLLQNARATLFPIEWEEPFGLVMIESMACGTPVVATRWGAVPEVIEHGVSGIVVDDHGELAAALEQADELDPLACRDYVERRFSAARMVEDYLAAYRLARTRARLGTDADGPAAAAGLAPAETVATVPATDAPDDAIS
jgi:glycosyltransferase involved in cell wall biosynthesis